MLRAIQLAHLGAGAVNPNPMVGALLVYNDRVISESWHEKFGSYHAERLAIEKVLNEYSTSNHVLQNSTLYVTLEPCNQYGKTPPCTEIIIKHKIPKVIIGQIDTNPIITNQGIETLKKAGINTQVCEIGNKCYQLNRYYNTFNAKKRPYIIIKWSQSANLYITDKINTRSQITDDYTTIIQHKYRAAIDGILIGYKTAIIDNPLLNTRFWPGKSPTRIVIDRTLSLPKTLNIFNRDGKVIIFNNIKTLKKNNIHYIKINCDSLNICNEILEKLYLLNLQSIIIEGGAATINLFKNANLWDEMHVYTSPKIINEGLRAPLKPNIQHLTSQTKLLTDYLEVYRNIL